MAGRTKLIEKQIGKYLVKKEIAHGGMGVVYEALHPELNKSVIIKKLTIHKKEIAERFKREAQILMEMQSQFIVNTYDYFQEGKSRYIVEEFVDGLSLNNLILHHGHLPCNIALIIFLNVCYALKFAHNRNIIHRDIKPANILLSKRAEVKLADFGIAGNEKEKHGEILDSMATTMENEGLTQAKSAMGTPAYMAPEQFTDSSSVDKRADIYSLGIMLFEMLTGKRPFHGGSSMKETYDERLMYKHVPLGALYKKKIPLRIYLMIRKMTMTKKDMRYQSVEPIIKIVSGYLKSYSQKDLLIQISRMVRHYSTGSIEPYRIRPVIAKRNIGMWLSVSTTILLILSWLFIVAIKQRFFYRNILSPWYKGINIELRTPLIDDGSTEPPSIVYFYRKNSAKEIKSMRSGFTSSVNKDLGCTFLYSPEIYFRPGQYRLKLVIGQYVAYRDFAVKKQNNDILKFDFLRMRNRPAIVRLGAQDYDTKEDITPILSCKVFYKGYWQLIESDAIAGLLSTGEEWKLKFSAKGYKDEIFKVKLDWSQDVIYIYPLLHKL